MELTVQYFALFREQVGHDQERLETEATTPGALFDELRRRHPGLERFEAMKVAVNDELSAWDRPLADGDTVLLFPPVAGG